MLVPNGAVSKVIGAKGSVISRITQGSGAFVSFNKAEEMPPEMMAERVLTLSGEAQNVTAAQQMVNEILATIEGGAGMQSPQAQTYAQQGYGGQQQSMAAYGAAYG